MADDLSIELVAKYDELIAGLSESQDAVAGFAGTAISLLEGIQASTEATAKATEEGFAAMAEATKKAAEESENSIAALKESLIHLIETLGVLEGIHIGWEWLKEGGELAEKLTIMSQNTGVATEELSRLKFVADSSGTSIDTVGMTIGRLNMRLEQLAVSGKGPIADGLKDLGIDRLAFTAADATNRFEMLGDALHKFDNNARAIGDVGEVLGGRGIKMVSLLENMRELSTESDKLAATLKDNTIAAADKFADSMKELSSQWDAFKVALAAALAGPLSGVVKMLQAGLKELILWSNDGSLQKWGTDATIAVAEFAKRAVVDLAIIADAVKFLVDGLIGAKNVIEGLLVGAGLYMPAPHSGAAVDHKGAGGGFSEFIDKLEADVRDGSKKFDSMPDKKQGEAMPDRGPTTADIAAGKAAAEADRQRKATFADYVAEQKLEVAEANDTKEAKISAYQKVYEEAVKLFGAQSKEARAAMVEELNAQKAAATEERQIQTQEIADATKLSADKMAVERAQITGSFGILQAQSGDKIGLRAQELEAQRTVIDKEYQVEKAASDQKVAIWAAERKEYDKYEKEREEIDLKHQKSVIDSNAAIAEANIAAAKQTEAEWETAFRAVLGPVESFVDSVMKGTTSIKAAFLSMIESMASSLLKSGLEGLLLGGKEGTAGNTLFGGGLLNSVLGAITGSNKTGGAGSGGLGLLGSLFGMGGTGGAGAMTPQANAAAIGLTLKPQYTALAQSITQNNTAGVHQIVEAVRASKSGGAVGGSAPGTAPAVAPTAGQSGAAMAPVVGGLKHVAAVAAQGFGLLSGITGKGNETLTVISTGIETIAAIQEVIAVLTALGVMKPSVLGTTFASGGFTDGMRGTSVADGMDGRVAIVHPGELVLNPEQTKRFTTTTPSPRMTSLPAYLTDGTSANAIRGGDSSNGGSSSSGGGVGRSPQINFNVSAMDARGVHNFFEQHASAITKNVHNQLKRYGATLGGRVG